MADSVIDAECVVLYDNWPGYPVKPDRDYRDMTAAGVGHNVAIPLYKVGTKWQVYNEGAAGQNAGWSTFVYLRAEPTADAAIAMIALTIVVPDDTIAEGGTAIKMYTVTGDSDRTTHEGLGLCAVSLGTMTNSYYGWFWCGGVAPIEYASGLNGDLVALDAVTASCELITAAAATTAIAFTIATAGIPACGYALTACD